MKGIYLTFIYFSDVLIARAIDRIACHNNLFLLQINLWVVCLQPGKSQNQVLLFQTGYCKQDLLQVGSILKYYVYHLRYLSSLILGAIHIVHQYQFGESVSVKAILFYKALINKKFCSSRVDQCMYGEGLRYISSFKKDNEIQRSSVGIKSIDSRLQEKFLFLSRAVRSGSPIVSGWIYKCVREITITVFIFFYSQYSKLIYQQLGHIICQSLYTKS